MRELPTEAPTIGRTGPITGPGLVPGRGLRVPDVVLDGVAAGRFRVAAASIIGSAHVAKGEGRQDGYAFCLGVSGRLYIVVADGLGSRSASDIGARVFCDEVVRSVSRVEGTDLSEIIRTAATRMASVVTDVYGVTPHDAACVAVVAMFDGQRCVIGRVGDCSAFTLVDGAFVETFAETEGYVNLVSGALPDDLGAGVDVVEVAAAPIVALTTDGLANDIRNSAATRSWLTTAWSEPASAFAIGDTLRYRRQGSHDDRTAVVVWTIPAEDTSLERQW